MKMIKAGLLAFSLTLVSHAAYGQYNPCCDWGEVTLSASALLWRVGACDTTYAQSSVTDAEGRTFAATDFKYLNPGWDWGVRVSAALDRSCYWGEVDYLWYEANGLASAKPPGATDNAQALNILVVVGAPGSWERVRANSSTRYQHATVSAGLPFCCGSCCRLDGVVLARYLDLSARLRIDAANVTAFNPSLPIMTGNLLRFPGTTGIGRAEAGFQGGGVGVGLKGACELKCGFEVKGRFNVFSFFGTSQTADSQFTITPPMTVLNNGVVTPFLLQDMRYSVPSRTCWVPGLEFGIGLVYGINCGCTALTLELGWDSYYYYHALRETNFESNTGQTGAAVFSTAQQNGMLESMQFNTIAFGGPTFSLRAEF